MMNRYLGAMRDGFISSATASARGWILPRFEAVHDEDTNLYGHDTGRLRNATIGIFDDFGEYRTSRGHLKVDNTRLLCIRRKAEVKRRHWPLERSPLWFLANRNDTE